MTRKINYPSIRKAVPKKLRPVTVQSTVATVLCAHRGELVDAVIDVEDVFLVGRYNWSIDSNGYPLTWMDGKSVRLHALLLGLATEGEVTDHINRNKLDNRRCNLRRCAPRTNVRNVGLRSDNKSGVRGVHWNKALQKWTAQVKVDGKTKSLGSFSSVEEAAKAAERAREGWEKTLDLNFQTR